MRRFQIPSHIWALRLAACACLIATVPAPSRAAGQTTVGVIQYNAKGGQGGWTTKGGWSGNEDIRAKQIKLVADEIEKRQKMGDPIDFITLEQADRPLLDGELKTLGLSGWTTLISGCQNDQVQLSYSAGWTLVAKTAPADGCWQPGRPFNIAYLNNAKTGATVLYVIVHMPHIRHLNDCTVPIRPRDFASWQVADFMADVSKAVGPGVTDLTKVNLIASGDMNELGACGSAADFANVFGPFGAVTKSQNLGTCCEDSGYSLQFDHVVTNRGPLSTPEIIDDGAYPMNPHFNNRLCVPAGSYCPHNEEHKAIDDEVTLPTP